MHCYILIVIWIFILLITREHYFENFENILIKMCPRIYIFIVISSAGSITQQYVSLCVNQFPLSMLSWTNAQLHLRSTTCIAFSAIATKTTAKWSLIYYLLLFSASNSVYTEKLSKYVLCEKWQMLRKDFKLN